MKYKFILFAPWLLKSPVKDLKGLLKGFLKGFYKASMGGLGSTRFLSN